LGERSRELAELFADGGRSVLNEAGLGRDWDAALSKVPTAILEVPDGEDVPFRLLVAMRDYWSSRRDLQPAVAVTRGLLRIRIERHGHQHPDTLMELGALGALAHRAGKTEEGGELLEKSFNALRSVVGGRDLRLAVVASNLARHRLHAGDLARAQAALEIAYRIRKEVAPQSAALTAAQLGEIKSRRGDLAGAMPLLKESWMALREQLGDGHAKTIARAQALSTVLNQLDRHSEAIVPLRMVYDWGRSKGNDDVRASAAFNLGIALEKTGSKEEGWRLVEEAIRTTRALSDGEALPHRQLANRLTTYASMQLSKRRVGEAEGVMMEALEAETRLFGDSSVEVASRYATLGYFYARLGRTGEALGWLDPAASLMRTNAGDDDPKTKVIVDYQAGMLISQIEAAIERREPDLAGRLAVRAWTMAEPVLGFESAKVRKIRELAEQLGLRV